MPILYKPFQSVMKTKESKRLFYPRVVLTGSVDTDRIAKEIAEYSSLTSGDVKNVVDNLIIVMTKHLQASESVHLEGLGSFRPTLRSCKPGAETADEVSPSLAMLTVQFTPSVTRNADRTVATRSLTTGARFARYNPAGESGNETTQPDGGNDDQEGESPDPIG